MPSGLPALFAITLALAFILGLAPLAARMLSDRRADRAEWRRLAAFQPDGPGRFSPAMVAGLPEPARRFFERAIRPGTPLLTVAEIEMSGRFSLGTRENPA